MSTFMIECMYCGHKWERVVYSESSLNGLICSICKDTFLRVRNKEDCVIDAYKGCTPFPEPPKDEQEPIFDQFNWLE